MKKTWLIIKREYLTRVRNRGFIISTILTPLFFVGLIAAITYFTVKQDPGGGGGVAGGMIERNVGSLDKKSQLAYIVGYISSFFIYLSILIYGTMVMRGVSEEKTTRISEIIISSVKPFQLMMGKIIGIGAVGLTQFLLWLVLIAVFSSGLFMLMPQDLVSSAGQAAAPANVSDFQRDLAAINLPLVMFCFIFYFLIGYLFYASLFAALGSAVSDDSQNTQSAMMPVTMPIVLAIVIMMSAITNPTGPLAVWSSMIPFFSPIVMMARVPFGVPAVVPWWQLGLSMLLLAGGFLFITWLSAKIYRTGILMYGKKISWKEMGKWMFRA